MTLLGDRGVAGPTVVDAGPGTGLGRGLRLNVGPTQAHRLRLLAAPDGGRGRGHAGRRSSPCGTWSGTVRSGWQRRGADLQGRRLAHRLPDGRQRAGAGASAWILFSTRPGGPARVREYAQRGRVDATFGDGKRRGWGLEQSHVREAAHLDRLLLVWHLALWWLHALGRHVITCGARCQFDRTDRRDRSLVRLGWVWLLDLLGVRALSAAPFRQTSTGWHAAAPPDAKLSEPPLLSR